MDDRIRHKLLEASQALSLYSALPPSDIEQVFNFDVRQMDSTPSKTLSRFTVMLGQYLITLQIKYNTAKVITSQKKKVLDRKVLDLLQKGAIEGKTLAERQRKVIASNPELEILELEYDEASAERDLLEGIDKPITELINAFKSELRRRAEERQHTDRERTQ